jgi:penicillin amidase
MWFVLSIAAAVAVVAAYGGFVLLTTSGEPATWEGEITLEGSSAPIEILRDEYGVPHVFAETETDAHFALGFLHAQDRLWQMAFNRQRLEGRLAEWMGHMALEADIGQREFFYPPRFRAAQWAAMPEEARDHLEAYAAGVNAYLGSELYQRPPEMRILHVHPESWEPEDALTLWSQLYPVLSGPGREAEKHRLERYARVDYADEYFLIHDDVPPIVEVWPPQPLAAALEPEGSANRSMVDEPKTATSRLAYSKNGAFSNGWVVSGRHTDSGLPLLANDPQLPSTAPNTWYLAHLSIASRAVVGATLPGVPGVIVGRTNGLAWGATNAGVDSADFIFAEVHPDDPNRYRLHPDLGWQSFETWIETYRVRFGADVEREVRASGPNLVFPSDMSATPFDPPNAVALLRSTGWEAEHSLTATLALNRAQRVEDGMAAATNFVSPVINLSMADTAGRIGYRTIGRVPRRTPEHANTTEFAPLDDNNWDGFLSASEMPHIVDPPSGRIVSANQLIVGPDYPHYLEESFAWPYRARRIHEMLDAVPDHDVDSFLAMQSDTHSPPAAELLPFLLNTEPANPRDETLLEMLAAWDARFELDQTAPTIFMTWAQVLQSAVRDDELGPELAARYAFGPSFPFLAAVLGGKLAHWCDDVRTEDVEESCRDQLASTLSTTHKLLEESLGADPDGWRWREAADFSHPHLGFAGLPLLDSRFSRTSKVPGGPESAFIHGVFSTQPPNFSQHSVSSSLQVIFDLADLDASYYVISGGQSGRPESPHYDDLRTLWERGERIRIPTRRADIKAEARLALLPSSRG